MIIALSGKKRSGKDTVCKIIQYLILQQNLPHYNLSFEKFINIYITTDIISTWQRKMFAYKLKKSLENEFPNEFNIHDWETKGDEYRNEVMPSLGVTRRKVLQLKGENHRNIHPDYWLNALFSDYIGKPIGNKEYVGHGDFKEEGTIEYPNWIITDCRFPNEAKAIKDRGGLIIRINRPINLSLIWTKKIDSLHLSDGSNTKCGRPMLGNNYNIVYREIDSDMGFKPRQYCEKCFPRDEHESETALDNYDGFDRILQNDCSMEKLVHRVKSILQTFKIIT